MTAKGISKDFAEQVFKQIRGFGDYGFPESHAASFALITYVTAWLKCHYPAVFTCALLNAQPMGFYAPSTIVDDAKRHGIQVRAIDVQESRWECTLEKCDESGEGIAVRIGLGYVHGFRESNWEQIEQTRRLGPFHSPGDFATRTGLKDAALRRLAEAGAFFSAIKN